MKRPTRCPHTNAANQYARDVINGKIVACAWVIAACRRHLCDLAEEKKRAFRFRFDRDKAERVCRFSSNLVHVKGKWAGKKIALEPWQKFVLCSVFGWVRKIDGLRRFRSAYVEVSRKNGKSVLAAVVGLFMFAADREPGAEVYSGATTEKQAWEVFRPALQMAKKSPGFSDAYGVTPHAKSLTIDDNGSRFEPIIGSPGDGASPSCAIVDEFHEHPTSVLYDTMETGMGAREHPLLLVITTAGTNLSGPCKSKHDQVKKILAGAEQNDETFGIIYSLDDDDDWTDYENWKKANPCLGASLNPDYLFARYQSARQETSRRNVILTKHCNRWCNANTAWMDMLKWGKCGDPTSLIGKFEGLPCVVAMDLASKTDVAALVLLAWKDDKYYVFTKYYLPRDTVDLPQNQHYQGWEHDERLTVTPGAVTDFDFIKEDLMQLRSMFDIMAVPYDPFQATQLSSELTALDFPMVELRPTVLNFSEPMKELEKMVLTGSLVHDGDPVMTWMMSNVVAHYDAKDNIYPRKERNENKIDGPVALIMAVNMALRMQNAPDMTPGIAIL